MKYAWLFVLLGIISLNAFNHFAISPKSGLANLIQLTAPEDPQTLTINGREAVIAKVYSTYPFNHRNLLTVNAGSKNGVTTGMPVTVDGTLLLGQVSEVWEDKSLVQTIFDKDFSLPVRSGFQEADALLVGGQTPKLSLIEANSIVNENDPVYSAGRNFPYRMAIGKVGFVTAAADNSLREASLVLPYQISDLREVAILIK